MGKQCNSTQREKGIKLIIYYIEEDGHKKLHTVWCHLYETLEQAKLTYGDGNQTSGCFWEWRWGLSRKGQEETS